MSVLYIFIIKCSRFQSSSTAKEKNWYFSFILIFFILFLWKTYFTHPLLTVTVGDYIGELFQFFFFFYFFMPFDFVLLWIFLCFSFFHLFLCCWWKMLQVLLCPFLQIFAYGFLFLTNGRVTVKESERKRKRIKENVWVYKRTRQLTDKITSLALMLI